MKKNLLFFLILFLISNSILCSNAFAEAIKNPKKAVHKLSAKIHSKLRSVQSINSLSVVKGAVTLLRPNKLAIVIPSIRSVYSGGSGTVKGNKKINLEGTLFGDEISSEGEDSNGNRYFFNVAIPAKLQSALKKGISGSKKVNFSEKGLEAEIGINLGSNGTSFGSVFNRHSTSIVRLPVQANIMGFVDRNSGVLKGSFTTEGNKKSRAKGRFILKLSD